MPREEVIKFIMEHSTFERQTDILIEEMAELIQAICKRRRGKEDSYKNYLEELADVVIMIQQMVYYAGEERVVNIVDEKLKRTVGRIQEGIE